MASSDVNVDEALFSASSNSYVAQGTGGLKRRRIAIACQTCRNKKTRCDGQKPICSYCRDFGFQCIFSTTPRDTSGAAPSQYPSLRKASPFVERAHKDDSNMPSQSAPQRIRDLELRIVELEALAKSGLASYAKSSPPINLPAAPSPTHLTGVSAMGLGNRDDANATYHQPMAPADLSVSVLRAVNGNSNGATASSYQQNRIYPVGVVYSTEFFKLPLRAEANRMLDTYERETWPLYPLLPGGTLRNMYYVYSEMPLEQASALPNAARWFSLFNAVFALASAIDRQPEDGHLYFSRSRQLVGIGEQITKSSILQIQAAAVQAMYLQSTDNIDDAWLTLGWVIRICFALGLHTSNPCVDRSDTNAVSLAARTYWIVFLLDRSMAMTLGRPGGIGAYLTGPPLPAPLHGEGPEQLHFLTTSISLYTILGNMLESLYKPVPWCSKTFMDQLDAWQAALPPSLSVLLQQTTPFSTQADLLHRVSSPCIVITFRCLLVRMLVYRPLLSQSLDENGRPSRRSSPSPLSTAQAVPEAQAELLAGQSTCTQDALRVISLSQELEALDLWLRGGSSWYRLYYVFSAFSVLAGSLLNDKLEAWYSESGTMAPSREIRMNHCRMAVSLMQSLQAQCLSAEHCAITASKIMDHLDRQFPTSSEAVPAAIGDATAILPEFASYIEHESWMDPFHGSMGPTVPDSFWGLSMGADFDFGDLLNSTQI